MMSKVFVICHNSELEMYCCASGSVSAGEESGVSLFTRELEAQMATERDEQVLAYN